MTRSPWHDESAASAVEYAILAVLIAVVIVAAVAAVGREVGDDFGCAEDAIEQAPYGCPGG